jgi:hypothetical protein
VQNIARISKLVLCGSCLHADNAAQGCLSVTCCCRTSSRIAIIVIAQNHRPFEIVKISALFAPMWYERDKTSCANGNSRQDLLLVLPWASVPIILASVVLASALKGQSCLPAQATRALVTTSSAPMPLPLELDKRIHCFFLHGRLPTSSSHAICV